MLAGATLPTVGAAGATSGETGTVEAVTVGAVSRPDLVVRNNRAGTRRTTVQLTNGKQTRTVVDRRLAGRDGAAAAARAAVESVRGSPSDGDWELVVRQGGETVTRTSVGLSTNGPAAYETIYVDLRDTETLVSRGVV